MNIRSHWEYVWVFLGLLLFVSACAKDDGYYKPTGIDKHFDGDTYAYLKSKPGVSDSLIPVIDRLELQSPLRDSNITLFALTNARFQLAINNLNNHRFLRSETRHEGKEC